MAVSLFCVKLIVAGVNVAQNVEWGSATPEPSMGLHAGHLESLCLRRTPLAIQSALCRDVNGQHICPHLSEALVVSILWLHECTHRSSSIMSSSTYWEPPMEILERRDFILPISVSLAPLRGWGHDHEELSYYKSQHVPCSL